MWRLLCGLLLLGSNSAVGAGLRLIENAQPRCAIVVPTLASPVEQQAAAELAHYLQLMSGAEVPIISAGEPVAQPYRLLVGRAEQVLAQPPKLHPEGFLLRTVDDGLIIAGGSDLGTLFAVYDFLERLGCRWLVPGELGQVVPLRPTVTVKDWNVVERPAFEIRSFALTGGGERAEWGLRNKINGFYSLEFAEAHGGALSFQPGTAGFHSFFQTLPAEEYFPDHPEIFPLLGGKRMKYSVRGGQLCTTNPEAVALAASVVRRYFREHPTARIYTLSPNDGYGWCECERCRAFDEQYAAGRTHASGRPITTDRLMYFLNQVQAQLRGEFPGRRLVTLSYVNYVEPPTTYVPEADIIAFQCHYTPACYAHPITDPDCPENRKFDAHLRRWVEVLRRARGEGQPVNLGIYAYTDKSMWFYLPRPVVRQMAADIQHFYELGIRSYYAQSSASVWALNLPLYYLTAKLLWNPQQDVEALLDDFYTNFFAAAAEPMRAYYQTFEEALARSRAHFNADPLSEAPPFLTPEVMAKARRNLEEAEKLAPNEVVRARIAAVRKHFEGVYPLWAGIWEYHLYEQRGDPAHLRRAAEHLRPLIEARRGSYLARRFQFLALVFDGVLWSGFGEEMEKGGRKCRNSDETGPGDNAAGWASFRFPVPDLTQPVRLRLLVWGESALSNLVICSQGRGKGTAAGGVWNPVRPEKPLSGKPQWEEMVFVIPPELFEPGVRLQIVGFGGGDSQIWIAEAKVEAVE